MRTVSGEGGSLYALGEPFAFTGLPLDDCGDGFTWRAADATLRCWVETHLFEAYEHGNWWRKVPEDVDLSAATVTFGRCLSGLHVRASGMALPTTLIAESARWTLEQPVVTGSRMLGDGGAAVALGSATARLTDVEGWRAQGYPICTVMAVLPSPPAGAYVGFGEPESDGLDVNVRFDERGVTYAYG